MKLQQLLLPIFLITFTVQSYAQDYVSEEKIELEVVRSDFSMGISPIVFVAINDYSSGPGIGLELMGLYALDNNFSVGGFLKVKGELNESGISGPGSGYNGNGTLFEHGAGSVGAIFEYKIFNKVGFNLRTGYEEIIDNDRYDPGFVYGGGVSLYIKRDDAKRALHSFNWGITFEGNNFTNVDILNPGTNKFESTEINSFYIQFGWRIQFHGLKPRN